MKLIIAILGYNSAGKSSLVKNYPNAIRLNRDELGGTLEGINDRLEKEIKAGNSYFVLDNTYVDKASRASIIKTAKANKIPIKCVWLATSFEDAQLNACLRMVKKTGMLLSPEEMKKTKDPNLFPPVALFNYRKKFEEPELSEGWDEIEKVEFVRHWGKEYTNKALILDFDGTLRDVPPGGDRDYPIQPSEVVILPNRTSRLLEYQSKGYVLLGMSNQSGIAKGILTEEMAVKCFDRTCELLCVKIDYLYCPHKIPPVSCYCRKPSVGMPAFFIYKYKLLPSECIFVGDLTSDQTCAERAGFQYVHPDTFFK